MGVGEGGGWPQIAARPRKPLPDHGVSLPIAINRSSNFRSKLAPGAITADGKPMADILDPMRRRALRHASPEGFETAIPRTPTECNRCRTKALRSEEHTSELQSLMRNSSAVFCLK